jgi:hypothetical protein
MSEMNPSLCPYAPIHFVEHMEYSRIDIEIAVVTALCCAALVYEYVYDGGLPG